MAAVAQTTTDDTRKLAVWVPLAGLSAGAGLLGGDGPPWVFMWVLAGSIYAGLKWLTFAECSTARRASLERSLGYLILWPGMNATAFFAPPKIRDRSDVGEWWVALAKMAFGFFLIFGAAPLAIDRSHLVAGWLGMAGIVFVLHFGLFHLLSLGWRRMGIDAPPVMNAPARSSSLAEFWGRRWNLAFRDVAHICVFRPLLPLLGPSGAAMAVFLASGLVHDLVISLPARGGWGLPTLYFVIQGVGMLFERTRLGRRIGLGGGMLGRLFCAVVTLAPACLLFHRPFIERVVLPMLAAIGALRH